jgi:hypothetical protein
MTNVEPADAHTRAFAPVLAAAVFLAGVLDALTTVVGLRAGLHESNPLARAAFAQFGVGATIAARIVIPPLLFGVVLYWMARVDRRLFGVVAVAVGFAVFCWLAATANNLVALASAR